MRLIRFFWEGGVDTDLSPQIISRKHKEAQQYNLGAGRNAYGEPRIICPRDEQEIFGVRSII